MKSSKYLTITIAGALLLFLLFGGITWYVDPLFHYHAPNSRFQYPLYDERYMNDGIVRHFSYDAIITGTSMTQNFKTSQMDSLFGTHSIKVPFAGSSVRETADLLDRAYATGRPIRYVLRSMDTSMLPIDKDSMSYDEYPAYLYDDNPFNDVHYLLSKDIYLTYTEYVFTFMRQGGNSTTFDTYANWSGQYEYNAAKLMAEHVRPKMAEEERRFTEEEAALMRENLEQNVLRIAREHPETQFLLFDPPYSLIWFDNLYRNREIDRIIDLWELEAELLLSCENIHLFSFYDDFDVILDLGSYKDSVHYNQKITDHLLECMARGEHELTKENYMEYFEMLRVYYKSVDYDTIFAECPQEE